MTMRVRCTTLTAMALLVASAPGRPLHSQVAADRMEALVQADRSASAASWKLGLRGALLEACDRDGVLLLPGAPLVIGTPDALQDLKLTGTVESVGRAFKEKSGDVIYTVRIQLEETDPRLRWGMTVAVDF